MAELKLEVKPLGKCNEADFFRMREHPSCDRCFCVAWYQPSWEGWTERTAQQNRDFRQRLFECGVHDGYLLYLNANPIGWMQVASLKTIPKLGALLGLKTAVEAHVISCMEILPEFRKKKLSRAFLSAVISDLKRRKIKKVLAVPKLKDEIKGDADGWNGFEGLFDSLGFQRGEKIGERVVYLKELGP